VTTSTTETNAGMSIFPCVMILDHPPLQIVVRAPPLSFVAGGSRAVGASLLEAEAEAGSMSRTLASNPPMRVSSAAIRRAVCCFVVQRVSEESLDELVCPRVRTDTNLAYLYVMRSCQKCSLVWLVSCQHFKLSVA
jgi:hypothetical protein